MTNVLYCVLGKALYGCAQVLKLWYLKLSEFLRGIVYESLEVKPCIFRKVDREMVYLLVLYVDDVLIIALEKEVEHVHKLCVNEFQWVTMETSKNHSYLGILLEFLHGAVCIDMHSYVDQVLQGFAG
jgi:hypothetical protein